MYINGIRHIKSSSDFSEIFNICLKPFVSIIVCEYRKFDKGYLLLEKLSLDIYVMQE